MGQLVVGRKETEVIAALVAAEGAAVESGTLRIVLSGEIGPDKLISLKKVAAHLRDMAALDGRHVHVAIDSEGGDPIEAFKIYNALRALPLVVSAQAGAHCCSSALIIFMAATHRAAKPDTKFLIHRVTLCREKLSREWLNANDLRRHAADLAADDDRVIDLLAARTGFSRDWFAQEIETETPLSLFDMLDTGIVHQIEGMDSGCNPAWPDIAQKFMADNPRIYIPPRYLTANYFAACRASAPASSMTSKSGATCGSCVG